MSAAAPGQASAGTPERDYAQFSAWWQAKGYPDGTSLDFSDARDAFASGMRAARDLAAREPDAPGVLLSDYLRQRGRPGVAAMVEEAERAAREPDAADGACREHRALQDISDAITEHDEADVKYPAELLVSIERIAELALQCPDPSQHVVIRDFATGRELSHEETTGPQPAPGLAAAPELRAAMAESRRYREALEQVAKHLDSEMTPAHARTFVRIATRALEGK